MQKHFMDLYVNYDLTYNLSAEFKYNINGNKQHAEGKISFLPDSMRIDLATPVRGFEDLTLVSNVNKKDRRVGFVFQKNGKSLDVELSASIENKKAVLTSVVLVGKDEYIVTLGAQNGTSREPKSMSMYIHGIKNKKSLLWLSLEGSYDLSTSAGLKISFSSVYYKQLLFEISSTKEEAKHKLIFNYLYGIEMIYSFNATLLKDIFRPQLLAYSQIGKHDSYFEISYDILSDEKTASITFKVDKDKFISILGTTSFAMLASKVKFSIQNQNLLSTINNVSVLGEYNFEDQSLINTSFTMNNIDYFGLFMDSSSLYNIQFSSSLLQSEYINTSYEITLTYKLALPDASMFSNVNINGEYYRCTGNLTWNTQSANTFFQLTTNGGYGFENTILSSKYSIDEMGKHSHFIDFTVDNSILFHISSDIQYPNQLYLNLVLPDSLFLPFVKEISIGVNFSDDQKAVLFKYLSGSKDKRKFNFSIMLQDNQCEVELGRSELDSENKLQSDNFVFSYLLTKQHFRFDTSLKWENNNIFSVFYHNKINQFYVNGGTLSSRIFNLKHHHSFNITVSYNRNLELAGTLNSSVLLLTVKHPTSLYHHQIGLSEVEYINKIRDLESIKVHYKNADITEVNIMYNNDKINWYNGPITTSRHLKVTHNNLVKSIHDEETCMKYEFLLYIPICVKWQYNVSVSGVSGWSNKPLSMSYQLDYPEVKIDGKLSTNTQEYTFGTVTRMHRDVFACSNFSLFVNRFDDPEAPFAINYETNCKNNLYGSFNIFERDSHEIRAHVDFKDSKISEFMISGENFPYHKQWHIASKFLSHLVTIDASLEKDTVQIQLKNTTLRHSIEVESSYDMLRKMEISRESDDLNKTSFGKFKIDGAITTFEWLYNVTHLEDGSIALHMSSDKNVHVQVAFDLINKKEFLLKINKNGYISEGNGRIFYFDNQPKIAGEAIFSIDGEKYEMYFERFVSSSIHQGIIKVKTPSNDYYAESYMNKEADPDSPFIIVKYKTPFYPLEFADVNIKYSDASVKTEETVTFNKTTANDKKEENYDVHYKQLFFGISAKINHHSFEDTKISIIYGDKYGIVFNQQSNQLVVLFSHFQDKFSHSYQTTIDIRGESMPYLNILKGKSVLHGFVDKRHCNILVSVKTPVTDDILMAMLYDEHTPTGKLVDSKYEIVVGKKTILKVQAFQNRGNSYEGNLFGEWKMGNSVNFHYFGQEETISLDMNVLSGNQTIVDSKFQFVSEDTSIWKKSFKLTVNKFFALEQFNPKITITREVSETFIVNYQLNFTNGLSKELSFSGNCSLSFPELKSFSVNSSPSINTNIILESYSSQYLAASGFTFKHNKMDALIKWKRIVKSYTHNIPDYSYLKFGGNIQKNSAEFYLNDNKFSGLLENSERNTIISAHLVNEKISKNISIFASVQYLPIFFLNISHTIFDSPCSVEIKVDRRTQSFESAVTIVYNNLKQQAFINGYLDSNPQYAEFIYIDIWQQTHEASIHVEGKDNEVTVRGKINSPALDENFLIVTLGNNNDKLDINLSDAFIFKAFKDNSTGLLEMLIYGNVYKLQCTCKDNLEVSIVSPKLNGALTLSLNYLGHKSFIQTVFDTDLYNFVFEINTNKAFTIGLLREGENVFETTVEIENTKEIFHAQLKCDIHDHLNNLSIKHTHNPILLVISLSSPSFLRNNTEIIFGVKNDDPITGVIEVKQETSIFKSYLALSKENRTLEITVEAPLVSEMDEVKINGIFNIMDNGDCEMKLTGMLSSAGALLYHGSVHFIKYEDNLSAGLIANSKLENHDDIAISFHLPRQLSRDMKINLLIHLPRYKPCEVGFVLCISEEKVVSSAIAKWQDVLFLMEFKNGNNPFYSDLYEWNLQYLENKLQIGAWMKPKEPITDYIYFLNVNDKRMFEVSHALVMEPNHFKSRLIVETALEGHEKYGIDLELQNLKVGKIVRILGSAPQIGKDLGIDFGFSYESLLNYAVLAQIKIPYKDKIKMARLYSLHKIHPNLSLSKLNYTLECTDYGIIGWEFEMFGSAPFILQGKMAAIDTKINVNHNIYAVKAKSFIQSNKLQLSLGLESPFNNMRKGELHFSGTQQLIGSELVLSLNSNELISINITEDVTRVKQIKVLSKWTNMNMKFLYEGGSDIVIGYICWDLFNKEVSQFGISYKLSNDNQKLENFLELLLPSVLIPKVGIKVAFKNSLYEYFSLIEVDLPGLVLEGKVAKEISQNMLKSGLQLKWAAGDNASKTIGMFYVTEQNEEEIKHYITLQHFAFMNDLMLTFYAKSTLYGINFQYSPLKEEEVTLELGYWLVEDDNRDRAGVKFVVLHPATNTLIYSVANVTSTGDIVEGGFSVAYQDSKDFKKVKYVEVFGKKNKKNPHVFIGLACNGNSLGAGVSIWEKENYMRGVTLEARVNQKDPLKLEIVHNMVDPGIEAELSYSLSRTYRLFAGMPNNNELTAKLSHTMYGRPRLDALASLRLNTSKILWGRFELPPMSQVGQEFYNGIMEECSDVALVSQYILKGFSDFLEEDFSEKVVLLLNVVSVQTEALINYTCLEVETVNKGLEKLGNIVQQVYNEDHFYFRTCHQLLKHAGSVLYDHFSCAVQVVANIMNNLFGPVADVAVRVWNVVQSVLSKWKLFLNDIVAGLNSPIKEMSKVVTNYQRLRQSVIVNTRQMLTLARNQLTLLEQRSADLLTQAELTVNELIRSMEQGISLQIQRLVNYKDTILAGFSVLGNTVEEMLEIVMEGIYRIREIRYTVEWAVKCADAVNSWFTSFRLEPYLREVEAFVQKVFQLVVTDVEKNFREYEVYLIRAEHILAGHYDDINKIPQVHYVKHAVNHIYQKAKWFWNYAKLNNKLRDAIKKYIENMKATLDELQNQLDQDERDLRSEYVYNAENNSLTFTQELPFEWRAFNELPEYNVDMGSGPITIPAREYSNMVQTMANYLWQDAKLLPYLLPPFGAEAFMSGDDIITFDNTFYQFTGECNSYLLASDMYHNTFSLVVNYTQENERDLLLITHDVEILVKNNLEIYINGHLQELPQKLGSRKQLSLERKVHSILITGEEGFSLECSTFQSLCKFHVNGWYLGKTAGLFGTYNNEPSDDFINPNRQPTLNIKEFTDAWAIDTKQCESKPDVSSSISEDITPYESMCELFFSSQSSPFLPCFNVVNPKAFYEMCMANSKGDNTCSSVLAYLTKCTSSGVQLWMPEFCSDISIKDATLLTGYSDIVEIPSKMSADVVFVVEQADCEDNSETNLGSLLANLISDLEARNMTDNKFAFISFDSEEAQIQTINGQIWTVEQKPLTNIMRRLKNTEGSASVYNSALDLAASLSFRPGASKIVILIHCSSCSHSENYGPILEKFDQNDITLHILQKENIMGKKGKMVSKAIGLEKSGAYPRKRLTKNIAPSPQLLQQVSVPQDLCTPIMINTNGTLFNLDVTKKSVKAWSGRVAQGAIPPTMWKQCENTIGSDNIPLWRCRNWALQSPKLKDWDQTALDEYMDTSRGVDLYTEYEEVDR